MHAMHAFLLAAMLLLCTATRPAAAGDGDWVDGRATFYDDNQQGSCKYRDQVPAAYGAWPDTLDGFAGSCGKCVEVACVNKNFGDNYGGQLQRSNACYDPSRTVVLKIVDSCPCVHANAYSNRRWCCGDIAHLDLGRAVFRQLASESQGVIGARWRVVDCSRLGTVSTNNDPSGNQGPSSWQLPTSTAGDIPSIPAWGHFSRIKGGSTYISIGGASRPQNVASSQRGWGGLAQGWMGRLW